VGLASEDLDHAAEFLWTLLTSGKSNEDAQSELGVDRGTYDLIKLRCLDRQAILLRKTPVEHVYAQYIIDQSQNIRELSEQIVRNAKDSRLANTQVAALRLRADLYDRILTKGQEVGIIHKQPDEKHVTGGFVIAELSSDDLRKRIQDEMTGINKMMREFGDGKFIDVVAGPTHHGKALPAAAVPDELGADAGATMSTALPEKLKRPPPKKKTPKVRRKKQRV